MIDSNGLLIETIGLLHPWTDSLRLLGVFTAYFDESTDEQSQSYIIIGGWIGSLHQWNAFSEEWKGVLNKYKIGEFRASDCNAGQEEFEGWSSQQVENPRTDLLDVLRTTNLTGLGVALSLPDYETFQESQMLDPYHLCFHYCLIEAARKIPETETVSFILDYRQKIFRNADDIFKSVKRWKGFEARNRLGSLATESSKEFSPLQAADWLSNEIFKHVRSLSGLTRKQYRELSAFLVTYQDLYKETIPGFFAELRACGLKFGSDI